MISAVNITLQYGERSLFHEVSFHIGPRDRIGLVGSNGAGKTTLLKVLLGECTPDTGVVTRARYVSVGYLPQEGVSAAGRTLYGEVESAFGSALELEDRLEQARLQMERLDHDSAEFREVLEVYGELQHRLEASDAFHRKAVIEKVLMGLGFRESDFARQTEEFSGGWQMRIALAKLLLMEPSLLLLDEPTNHLDLDSLQWLEEYLRGYEGAVMIVSHDRRFLDNMTSRTFELSLGRLAEYTGNFSAYVEQQEARRGQTLAAYKNQQQQIKQTERFIERFRYKATKARQVQSRIRQLEKLDRIELEDQEGEIRFAFPPAPPSGRVVLELRNVDKSYGTLPLFRGLSFDIDRGDRIAFVGVNGAGKSTLSRIIAGVESFDRGERIVGHNVTVCYFAQHQAEELDPDHDVLQTVESVATGETRSRLRTLLGSFLFTGDDVFKSVRVLSGGEKSRLALAKMLLRPSNLIVLDEPTNHLDMRSKGVLQEALMDYGGSCVIVSHDRDFLDPLVTKVVEFRGGRIRTYLGNVSDYTDAKKREEGAAAHAPSRPSGPATNERDRKRREAEQRQLRYERTRPLQQAIERLEQEIERNEQRKTALEAIMADPAFYRDGERVKELTAEYRTLQGELNDQYHRWNDLDKELQKVQDEFQPPPKP
jgi:ATP-binding cassette subfamily F protein 3